MDLKKTYNLIAKDWVEDHKKDVWWWEGADELVTRLPQKGSVLDVGCAGGMKTNYLKEKGCQVEGIDFSPEMIRIAKENYPELTFSVMDVFDLDDYDKKFDGIFAQAVLLHVPKSRIIEALEKLRARLNVGGYLYIAVKDVREGRPEETIIKEKDYGYEYERFFSYYTLEEMTECFEKVGMKVVWDGRKLSGNPGWVQLIAVLYSAHV